MGTIVRRVDVDKVKRQSHLMLRILLCFDVFFLVSTIVQMIWLTPAVISTNEDGSWDLEFLTSLPYLHGYCFLIFFGTSLICNSLACVGVSKSKRMLLLPWLIVFMGFEAFLIMSFIADVLYSPFNLSQIFLLLLVLCVSSAWRHIQLTFIVMGLPAAASDNVETGVNTADTPPKYEDVTEKPPKYDEATMTAQQ